VSGFHRDSLINESHPPVRFANAEKISNWF
jgi:hypothetical protein